MDNIPDFQTSISDMFGRFQRCFNNEGDLTRILSIREHRHCNDLQRARDENRYILARQDNMLWHIQKLTREQDEVHHTSRQTFPPLAGGMHEQCHDHRT
jgi:hypothetical protein